VQRLVLRQHHRNYTEAQIEDLFKEYSDGSTPRHGHRDNKDKEVYKVFVNGHRMFTVIILLIPVRSPYLL
jgi:hypothetical protein